MPCHGVDELARKWTSIFTTLIEKHAPYRELRVSERYCPWVTLELKNLIRKRDKLKRNAIENGVLGNELLWFKSYISNRKQCCRVKA